MCVCPEVILHPFMRNVSLAAGLRALINDAHIVLDPSQINQGAKHNGITLSCFIHRLASTCVHLFDHDNDAVPLLLTNIKCRLSNET